LIHCCFALSGYVVNFNKTFF